MDRNKFAAAAAQFMYCLCNKFFSCSAFSGNGDGGSAGGDLTDIIQSFWRSVSRVWTEKLAAMGEMTKVTDEYAQVLGSWPAEKEKAMSRKKAIDRIPIITAVITKETLPLFANIKESDLNPNAKQGTVISNKTELKQVTLRFPDDLYKGDTGAIDILSGIFDYDFLDGSPRHRLISAMEIPVCPYCNRQYITSYSEDGDQMTTADLDHYYCKSIYPFLALSLYNFIPSCQICNSRFKLAKDFYLTPHLYPYDGLCGNEVKFRLANDRLLFDESAWNKKEDPFLKIETRGEAAANAKATFHLEEVYESHREYVHEIAWKNMVYSEEMIASLQKDFSGLFDEERDVRDLIFGQYINEDEAYKRPLGKLTKDILDEINKSK